MAFDIEPHYARRREQIWGAVRYAVGKGEGRMGEVGKERGREEGLPGYERVEGGEEPPGYDEVVVREEEEGMGDLGRDAGCGISMERRSFTSVLTWK